MVITGTTRDCFIPGDPVSQVRAPEGYARLVQRHGIDVAPVPLNLPAAAPAGFVEHGVMAGDIGGCLATMPRDAGRCAARRRRLGDAGPADPRMPSLVPLRSRRQHAANRHGRSALAPGSPLTPRTLQPAR